MNLAQTRELVCSQYLKYSNLFKPKLKVLSEYWTDLNKIAVQNKKKPKT